MSIIVDIVTQSWNQLHKWVFEGSEAIIGLNSNFEPILRHTKY